MTTLQNLLKSLKTNKPTFPSTINSVPSGCRALVLDDFSILNNLNQTQQTPSTNSPFQTTPSPQNLTSFLHSLSPHKFQSFLSDPHVQTSHCLLLFNTVLRLQDTLSFKPDLHAHLTLICRLIKSRCFIDAEFMLKNAIFSRNYRYPFCDFVSWCENYCVESRIVTKLLNMLLKTYSDHHMFDLVTKVFDYMVDRGFELDERTCSVCLYAMIRCNHVDLAYVFFRRMVECDVDVSVYSVTIVVSGLCKIGEVRLGRVLVDEVAKKGVKPNCITFNTLVDACVRRWDFDEVDLVLELMARERVGFSDMTYKVLIEGYASFGKIVEAEKLLLEMLDKGFEVETYLFYIVIKGYCRLGDLSSGVSLFRNMQERRKIVPNADIYLCLISGLCKVGDLGLVKELVKEMYDKGNRLDDSICKIIVDAYSKVGMVDEVEEMICMMKAKCSSSVDTLSKKLTDSQSELGLVSDSDSEFELVVDDEVMPLTPYDLK